MPSAPRKSVAVGIDFGSTRSGIGIWRDRPRGQEFELFSNDSGDTLTPSCIAFTGTERLVGGDAAAQASRNPRNTVWGAKRLLGRRFSDHSVQSSLRHLALPVVEGPDDKPLVEVELKGVRQRYTAEELSCLLLANLRRTALLHVGVGAHIKAVLTVPASFGAAQREAAMHAAEAAGIEVLRVMTDTSASALAYATQIDDGQHEDHPIVVFDLGGAHCQAAVATVEDGVVEMNAVVSADLGADDFHRRIALELAQRFDDLHQTDIRSDPRAMARLLAECEKAKMQLSSANECTISIDSLHRGIDCVVPLSRAQFESMCADLLDGCMAAVARALKDAGMPVSPAADADGRTAVPSVRDVLLVGGGTRIPKLQQLLLVNGRRPRIAIAPEHAAALGAAVQARMLSGGDICKRARLAGAPQDQAHGVAAWSPCPPVTPARPVHTDTQGAPLALPPPSAAAAPPVQQQPEYHKGEQAWYYGLPAGRVLAKIDAVDQSVCPASFSVRLPDGKVRETEASRLSPLFVWGGC